MNRVPLRPFLVGITQSNISTPARTPSTRSSGVPTPITYRGVDSGSRGASQFMTSSICSFDSPTDRLPIAYPSKPIAASFSRHMSRRSLKTLPLHYPEKGLTRAGCGLLRTHRPAKRAADRFGSVLQGNGIGRAFVEAHHDVRPEVSLDADSSLGGKKVAGAVDVRLKPDALFLDLVYPGEAEDLEPAAVSQNRVVPAHEFVKPAQAGDPFVPGAQVEVIRICEDDLRSHGLQIVGGNAFDGPCRSNRHEYGSIDRAAGGFNPCRSVRCFPDR